MMNKRVRHTLLALAIAAPTAALATSQNYNYFEGGLALYPGFDSQDFIGVDLRGSFEINEDIFAFGGLKYLTDDLDLTAIHVGGGYRHAIDDATSVWGGVTLEYQDIDGGRQCFPTLPGNPCANNSVDDTSFGLRGGLRHQLNQDLEIGGSLRLITGDLDYVGITGTTRYKLNENLILLGELDIYDGELGLIGGVTFFY